MKTGFTLVELVIVIIILGVLATIAVTQYIGIKERALGKEAIANLKLIAAAERVYRIEIGGYYPPISGSPESDVGDINNYLKLSLSGTNWGYSITSTAIDNFTAYADRQGSGGFLDCQYTFTYNDPDGEPNPTGCP